jgi:hypothetical protein
MCACTHIHNMLRYVLCLCLLCEMVSSLHILGFYAYPKTKKLQASIVKLNETTGMINRGKSSHAYDIPMTNCINARLSSASLDYAILLSSSTYLLLNFKGTMSKQNFLTKGANVDYEIVTWSYSENLKSLVMIGWQTTKNNKPINIGSYRALIKHSFDKHLFIPKVSIVKYQTGNIKTFTNVSGSAFLMCTSVVSGDWFHYAYLDNSPYSEQYTMSINLATGKQHSMHFSMDTYTSIITITISAQSLNNDNVVAFLVITENNIIRIFHPLKNEHYIIGALNKYHGTISIGSSFAMTNALYSLLVSSNDEDDQVVLAKTMFTSTSYLDVFQGNFTRFANISP